jgi:hypothetical protein
MSANERRAESCALTNENHAQIRGSWGPDGSRAVGHDKNIEPHASRHTVGLLAHRAGITIDVKCRSTGQLSARFVLGVSTPISHSRSFDHRRLARLPLTAVGLPPKLICSGTSVSVRPPSAKWCSPLNEQGLSDGSPGSRAASES